MVINGSLKRFKRVQYLKLRTNRESNLFQRIVSWVWLKSAATLVLHYPRSNTFPSEKGGSENRLTETVIHSRGETFTTDLFHQYKYYIIRTKTLETSLENFIFSCLVKYLNYFDISFQFEVILKWRTCQFVCFHDFKQRMNPRKKERKKLIKCLMLTK